MSKKGFTLVELLVVIAIIGILSLIIIPSVINVNKGINERLYSGKVENIESSATLYASNNEDIFNGQDEVVVYVYELINSGYLTIDIKSGDPSCDTESAHKNAKGCIVDPRRSGNNSSLNMCYVILRKSGAGFTAEFVNTNQEYKGQNGNTDSSIEQLVCAGFESAKFKGQSMVGGNVVRCKCDSVTNPTKLVQVDNTSNTVEYCLISGENPNNYLKYGDTNIPNWRVLGLYMLDNDDDGIKDLHAKMITSDPV